MKTIFCRKNRIFRMIILFLIVLATLAPMTVSAAENPLSLTVYQVFNTSSADADDSFTYILKPLEIDNPMPSGLPSSVSATGFTFRIKGTGEIKIGAIYFSREGIYSYELYQVISERRTGYTYDDRVYTIEIYADGSLNVNVVVKNENGEKMENITFTNSYSSGGGTVIPPGTTDPPKPITPPGTINPPRPITPPGTINPPRPTNPPAKTEPGDLTDPIYPIDPLDPPERFEQTDPTDPIDPIDPERPGVDGPKTGDESDEALYIKVLTFGILLSIAAAGILIVDRNKRRVR